MPDQTATLVVLLPPDPGTVTLAGEPMGFYGWLEPIPGPDVGTGIGPQDDYWPDDNWLEF